MDLRMFLAASYNVHESRHANEVIYIGHDQANRWTAFFKGKDRDLGLIDTLEQAKAEAHRQFDSAEKCPIALDWKLVPETEIKDLTK